MVSVCFKYEAFAFVALDNVFESGVFAPPLVAQDAFCTRRADREAKGRRKRKGTFFRFSFVGGTGREEEERVRKIQRGRDQYTSQGVRLGKRPKEERTSEDHPSPSYHCPFNNVPRLIAFFCVLFVVVPERLT